MLDIIFCSIPYRDLDQIYSAPAILKSIVQDNGYQAQTKDFGLDLLELCDRNVELFLKIQSYFTVPDNPLTKQQQLILDRFYQQIVDYFKKNPSKYIGFSIFSILTHKAIIEITQLLKDNNINSKIVVGGRGAKVSAFTAAHKSIKLTSLDKLQPFGQVLVQKKLVDQCIIGDGEDAILNIFENKPIKENNIAETFEYPLPDYSDYEFDKYLWEDNEIMFPVTGSRGCVRKCDFCDIQYQFGKYKYRSGRDIANEMIKLSQIHGYRKFQFTDSLVNGGLKPLEEFCTILAEYNDHHPDHKIRWNGQYVCRPEEQMPERLYPLMARSGAHGLTIGAESGSNHVLEHMNKKTTVDALLYELELFQKYGITCYLLTFVGHWAETHEDFIEHCKMLVDITPYARSGTISGVNLGTTAQILPGTPSIREVEQGSIVVSDFNKELIWSAKYNLDNTFKERIKRRLIIHQLAQRLKLPLTDEVEYLTMLNASLLHDYKKINEFYENITTNIE